MKTPHIAFLGLGLMGSGMACRLLANGFTVAVYNRDRSKAAPLVTAGGRLAATPRAAAAGAAVIISMVADDAAARAVWLGPEGALAAASAGAVGIECSTVTPAWVEELAAAAGARGVELIDAPVTGSRTHAAAGELKFLVGGAAAVLEKVRPVLAAMGKGVVHVGPRGSGALLKIVNNFLCGAQVAAFAEAVALVERSGLDRETALAVITAGAAGSPIVNMVAPRMTAGNYEPHFLLRLMAKDLGYALQAAAAAGLEPGVARAASAAFARGIAAGRGAQDIAALVEQYRAAAPQLTFPNPKLP